MSSLKSAVLFHWSWSFSLFFPVSLVRFSFDLYHVFVLLNSEGSTLDCDGCRKIQPCTCPFFRCLVPGAPLFSVVCPSNVFSAFRWAVFSPLEPSFLMERDEECRRVCPPARGPTFSPPFPLLAFLTDRRHFLLPCSRST